LLFTAPLMYLYMRHVLTQAPVPGIHLAEF
jgi:hypothetical protein